MPPLLEWLAALPPEALYVALAVTAAVENIFPPLPADTVVAFGSFLAARGEATAVGAFLSTWVGNVAGAMIVYGVARRYGSGAMHRRLVRYGDGRAEERLGRLYQRYGIVALFLTRFLPGVRALVPPFAGALRLPAVPVGAAIALASALWYGAVTMVAYRVGADWETLRARVGQVSRTTALVAAGALLLLAGAGVLYRRLHRKAPGP